MKKSEKVEFIISELEKLYNETPIPLDHTDSYTLLSQFYCRLSVLTSE